MELAFSQQPMLLLAVQGVSACRWAAVVHELAASNWRLGHQP